MTLPNAVNFILCDTQSADWPSAEQYVARGISLDTISSTDGRYILFPMRRLPPLFNIVAGMAKDWDENDFEGGAFVVKRALNKNNSEDLQVIQAYIDATLPEFDLEVPDGTPDSNEDRGNWWQRVRNALGI